MTVAQGTTIVDGRRLPFFVITKAATAALRAAFTGRELATARSLYAEIVECANDTGSDRVAPARDRLAERAGLHRSTVTEYLERLESVGLVRVTRQVGHPSVVSLLEPVVSGDRGVVSGDGYPSSQATGVSSQTTGGVVSGDTYKEAPPTGEKNAAAAREPHEQADDRLTSVVVQFPTQPAPAVTAAVAEAVSILRQAGVNVSDPGTVQHLADQHPNVDIVAAARRCAERTAEKGETIGAPIKWFRPFVERAPQHPVTGSPTAPVAIDEVIAHLLAVAAHHGPMKTTDALTELRDRCPDAARLAHSWGWRRWCLETNPRFQRRDLEAALRNAPPLHDIDAEIKRRHQLRAAKGAA